MSAESKRPQTSRRKPAGKRREPPPRRPLSPLLLDQVAEQLATWYEEERSMRRRGSFKRKPTPAAKEDFRKLAAELVRRQIGDVREFLHAQFVRCRNRSLAPSIANCGGRKAFEFWSRWRKERPLRAAELKTELEFQRQHYGQMLLEARMLQASMEWRDEELSQYVLLDVANQLSPLFRFCAATQLMNLNAASAWQDKALLQYVTDRASYDQAWGDLIPKGLQSAAKAFHIWASIQS